MNASRRAEGFRVTWSGSKGIPSNLAKRMGRPHQVVHGWWIQGLESFWYSVLVSIREVGCHRRIYMLAWNTAFIAIKDLTRLQPSDILMPSKTHVRLWTPKSTHPMPGLKKCHFDLLYLKDSDISSTHLYDFSSEIFSLIFFELFFKYHKILDSSPTQ